MSQQCKVRLLQVGRSLWQRCSLPSREDLSPQLSSCCAFNWTQQGKQHGDVQLSNIRAHLAPPPVYSRHVVQNGDFLRSCLHRLMVTSPGGVSTVGKTLGSCTYRHCSNESTAMDFFIQDHYMYAKRFYTASSCEPASIDGNIASGKALCKISVFGATSSPTDSSSFVNSLPQFRRFCSGLWNKRRRDPAWIGRRSFSSSANHKTFSDLGLKQIADSMRALDDAGDEFSLPNSDEDFDFRNFPALKSSFYQDYERPQVMQVKKRVTRQQTRTKPLDAGSNLTVEAIPQPKGRAYDFGLGDLSSKAPWLEAGARPQGGFDIDISLDDSEAASSGKPTSFLAFPPKKPCCNLPWRTPEADNWSEIGADPQRDEEGAWKPEQELCWDPYDFDASVKLPHKLESEEGL